MRLPLSAFAAFAEDSRKPGSAEAGNDDRAQAWLTIASAAETLGSLRGRERTEFLREFDDSLLPPAGKRPSIVHDVAPAPDAGLGQVAERFRVAAEEMERGGFLNLAYTTVSAICRVMVREDNPSRLMTTIHLGRIARELSDLSVAIDCYRSVVTEGLRERDGPSAARGFLGLALVAVMRGNYPLVRSMFEQMVQHALPGSNTEGLGQMGLSNVARREGKFADALIHGWRAHDITTDPDERLGILGNLSVIALDAGFPKAAMNGFLHVLSLSETPDNVLGVLHGAMLAAAELKDEARLRQFHVRGNATASAYNQPFEIARVELSAGTAWQRIGKPETARIHFGRALEVASAHEYHELGMLAEAALGTVHTPPTPDQAPKPAHEPGSDERLAVGIARLVALGA